MLTYAMLYQMLREAEERRDNPCWPEPVRASSAETVALIEERMHRDGLTRETLAADYKIAMRNARS